MTYIRDYRKYQYSEIEVTILYLLAKVYNGHIDYILILLWTDRFFWSVLFVHRLAHSLCSSTSLVHLNEALTSILV